MSKFENIYQTHTDDCQAESRSYVLVLPNTETYNICINSFGTSMSRMHIFNVEDLV